MEISFADFALDNFLENSLNESVIFKSSFWELFD